jgi:hypothetical protein
LCHRRPKSAIFRPPRVKKNHKLEVDHWQPARQSSAFLFSLERRAAHSRAVHSHVESADLGLWSVQFTVRQHHSWCPSIGAHYRLVKQRFPSGLYCPLLVRGTGTHTDGCERFSRLRYRSSRAVSAGSGRRSNVRVSARDAETNSMRPALANPEIRHCLLS